MDSLTTDYIYYHKLIMIISNKLQPLISVSKTYFKVERCCQRFMLARLVEQFGCSAELFSFKFLEGAKH